MEKTLLLIFMISMGLFPIFCAAKDYDWFMEHRKAKFLVKLFGRKAARIFYAVLGVAVIFCALMAYRHGQI